MWETSLTAASQSITICMETKILTKKKVIKYKRYFSLINQNETTRCYDGLIYTEQHFCIASCKISFRKIYPSARQFERHYSVSQRQEGQSLKNIYSSHHR